MSCKAPIPIASSWKRLHASKKKEKDHTRSTLCLQRTLSFHLYIILHTTAFGIIFEVLYLTARDLIKAPACTFTPGFTLCTNHGLRCLHYDPDISMTFRKHFSHPWLRCTLQSLKSKHWNSQTSIYFIYIFGVWKILPLPKATGISLLFCKNF